VRNTESRHGGTVSIKTAVGAQNMEVRMPAQKITERVNGDDRPWNRVFFRHGFFEKCLQSFPCATGEVRKEAPIVKKIPTQNLGYAEDKMPVGYILEDFFTKPLAELHHTFLMARRAEMATFA